jgi:hypothetical protein
MIRIERQVFSDPDAQNGKDFSRRQPKNTEFSGCRPSGGDL